MIASVGYLLQQAIGAAGDACQQEGIKKEREKRHPIVLRRPLTSDSQQATRLLQQRTDIAPRRDERLHLLLLSVEEGVESMEIGKKPGEYQTPIEHNFGLLHTTHDFDTRK